MTLGYAMDYGIGRVFVTEYDQIWTPNDVRRGQPGAILIPGSGNPRGYADPVNQPSSVKLASMLCTAGIPCISGDTGGQTWASDTAMSRIDSSWALLKSTFPTINQSKFYIIGASMGGGAASRYCQLHPDRIAAMVGLIPLLDIKAFYARNPGAVANEMSAAWGVANGAPLPAGADNAGNAYLAKGVPLLTGFSTVDTTVLPDWVTRYTSAVNGTAIVSSPDAGHSDASIGGIPVETIGQFLAAHAG